MDNHKQGGVALSREALIDQYSVKEYKYIEVEHANDAIASENVCAMDI